MIGKKPSPELGDGLLFPDVEADQIGNFLKIHGSNKNSINCVGFKINYLKLFRYSLFLFAGQPS